jgi:hypothetical protein
VLGLVLSLLLGERLGRREAVVAPVARERVVERDVI